jgi:hypothetical protein
VFETGFRVTRDWIHDLILARGFALTICWICASYRTVHASIITRASLCNKANTHKNSTEEACSETGDSSKTEKLTETLSKSLALFNMQALEKERQKNNFLKEQILRDQGVALSRKQNLISQQYSTLLNRHPTDNMALEATEKSIDEIDVSNKCFGDQTDFAAGYQDSATITSNQKSP